MEEDNKFSFKQIWSLVMAVIYFAIAYFVIFTPNLLPYNFQDNLKENDQFKIVRVFLGIAMFVYGVFRAYKVFKNIKK